jgi:hypothetical protein
MDQQFEDIPEKVYHGTTSNHFHSLREAIDVNIGIANDKPDFGKGFYTTTNIEQAWTQANRKAKFNNRKAERNPTIVRVEPIVLEYKVDTGKLSRSESGLVFNKPDKSWAEFVYNNRRCEILEDNKFHNRNQTFDYIFGPLADGFIIPLVDMLEKSEITWEQFLKKITPYKEGNRYQDQLSFHTMNSAKCLSLKRLLNDRRGDI